MKSKLILLLLMSFAATAQAEEAMAKFKLSDVISTASALTTLLNGVVLAATPDGAYFCSIELNPAYLRQINNNVAPSPGYAPTSFCVAADNSN